MVVPSGIKKTTRFYLGGLEQFDLNFIFFASVPGSGHIQWLFRWFHVVVLHYFFGGFLGCFLEGLMVIDKWFHGG
jgi:hypothetical protein